MKLKKLEKQIESEILMFLRAIGIYCWKNPTVGVFDMKRRVYRKPKSVFHIRGASDILAIIQGRMLAIEVKSETGRLSDDQRVFLTKINEEGGIAFCTRSVENCAEQLLKFFPDNPKLKSFYADNIKSNNTGH